MFRPARSRAVTAALLFGLLALAACGRPTPYQPMLDGRGYAEQPLEEDRYRVTFSGNSLTPRESVENYVLYRAAELTLFNGYDHFVVVGSDTERSSRVYGHSTGFGVFGGFGLFGGSRSGVGLGASTGVPVGSTSDYTAYVNVVMRHGPRPDDQGNAFDARAVLANLGPEIDRGGT